MIALDHSVADELRPQSYQDPHADGAPPHGKTTMFADATSKLSACHAGIEFHKCIYP